MTASGQPPYRAEHVGSLLRPKELTQAFRAFNKGELDEATFHKVQDAAIKDVVERLNANSSVEVETNAMSTQIRGEYDEVMAVLNQEMKETFERNPKAVFVMKILNNPVAG